MEHLQHFSSFILETGMLVNSSQWVHAFINILFSNVFGALALLGGVYFGRIIGKLI